MDNTAPSFVCSQGLSQRQVQNSETITVPQLHAVENTYIGPKPGARDIFLGGRNSGWPYLLAYSW